MRAIMFSEDNKPKIAEYGVIPKDLMTSLNIYLRHHEVWYLVSGYVSPTGKPRDWAILPAYIIQHTFDYDADKIQTDFVNLVRKEAP